LAQDIDPKMKHRAGAQEMHRGRLAFPALVLNACLGIASAVRGGNATRGSLRAEPWPLLGIQSNGTAPAALPLERQHRAANPSPGEGVVRPAKVLPVEGQRSNAKAPVERQRSHAKAPRNSLDAFTLVYWSTVLLVLALAEFLAAAGCMPVSREWRSPSWIESRISSKSEAEGTQQQGSDSKPSSDEEAVGAHRVAGGMGGFGFAYQSLEEYQLPRTMYALTIVAALGQTSFQPRGVTVPGWLIVGLCVVMSMLQLLTIYLVLHDLNPHAHPVTINPGSPWIRDPWTVNLMKWLMTFFFTCFLTSDSSQCLVTCKQLIAVDSGRLSVPRAILLPVALFQNVIMLGTVFTGVSAILSMTSVPDIVYSSLAISFIAQIDDMFCEFVLNALAIKADWDVRHDQRTAWWFPTLGRAFTIFPMIWGLYQISHAFYTNIMPQHWL